MPTPKKIGEQLHMATRLVNPADLRLDPENERDYLADAPENVALRQSLAAEGVKMPLMIYEDGTVSNGNRRLFNLRLLIEQGAWTDGKKVPAIIVERPANAVEAIFNRLNINEAEQFAPLEQGRAFAKLRDAGLNNTQIANRSPFTSMHVGNMLTLHDASDSVHALVRDRKISATLAVEVLRQHGEQIILDAVALATEQGKDKATQRHVDAVIAARMPVQPQPDTGNPTVAPTTDSPDAPFDGGTEAEAEAEAEAEDEDETDLSDEAPGAAEVEAESEVEADGTKPAAPAKVTPKSMVKMILPFMQTMESLLNDRHSTQKDKIEALRANQDVIEQFLAQAGELGIAD